jgi:hypothetical protein
MIKALNSDKFVYGVGFFGLAVVAFIWWVAIDMPAGRPPTPHWYYNLWTVFTAVVVLFVISSPVLNKRDWNHVIASVVLLVVFGVAILILLAVASIQTVSSFVWFL